MVIMQILLTYLIWFLTYIPLILVSAFVVPVMLACDWQGYTTWCGNRKYGRFGNAAYPTGNLWQEWQFLVIRNPISNFGKEVMAVTAKSPVVVEGNPHITDGAPGITGRYFARSGWAWEIRMVYKTFPGKCFEGRWGWKLLNSKPGDKCTFVCRANPFKHFG